MPISTRRGLQTQTLHDQMVRSRALALQSEGYYVRADIAGFPQPPMIGGFIPDVYATKGISMIITEAETCDTICTEHTRQQYSAFSNVLHADFHIIVPESCLREAQSCASRWGIQVEQWWYYRDY